jgi:hypothetical protein
VIFVAQRVPVALALEASPCSPTVAKPARSRCPPIRKLVDVQATDGKLVERFVRGLLG